MANCFLAFFLIVFGISLMGMVTIPAVVMLLAGLSAVIAGVLFAIGYARTKV